MKNLVAALVGLFLLTTPVIGGERPTVFVTGEETVDASNSKDKAKNLDFTTALIAALHKKEVPVLVVTDETKAKYRIEHTSSNKTDSTGTRIAKMAFGFGSGGSTFSGAITVIDIESTAVVFAYNVKKGNFQSAAEAFAKHFHNDYLKKQY